MHRAGELSPLQCSPQLEKARKALTLWIEQRIDVRYEIEYGLVDNGDGKLRLAMC